MPRPLAQNANAVIRVLHARAANGRGPIQSSINICKAMTREGAPIHFYAARINTPMGDVNHTTAVPSALSRFYDKRVDRWASRKIQDLFLRDLGPKDVAWLYPTVTTEVYEEVSRRGNPIIMEGVNTRMAHADRVLRPEYAALGMPYSYLKPVAIELEERMLALATHFFVPSPVVRDALAEADSSFQGRALESCHGVWRPDETTIEAARRAKAGRDRPVVLFCGTIDIRKAAHYLLRAWDMADLDADLVLCGRLAPAIEKACKAELSRPNVHLRGYVKNIATEYLDADAFVMPSLEEGGPKVTAEAAAYALPLVVSRAGGSWFWEDEDSVLRIEPQDTPAFATALGRIVSDADLRSRLGQRARLLSERFDWGVIGKDRYELLCHEFPALRGAA